MGKTCTGKKFPQLTVLKFPQLFPQKPNRFLPTHRRRFGFKRQNLLLQRMPPAHAIFRLLFTLLDRDSIEPLAKLAPRDLIILRRQRAFVPQINATLSATRA